jgi:ATP-dependent DNA ligase
VRLFTRNGYDWSDRYPIIVEAALRNRAKSFVIDGEAVLLGVDGVSDFARLHSRQNDDQVQLYAFDVLALDGEDLRKLALSAAG